MTDRRPADTEDRPRIVFPLLECWNPQTEVVSIAAQVDKQRVLCRISLQDLENHFGASHGEPLRTVVENRPILERSARRLIEAQAFEPDGSILMHGEDIDSARDSAEP
jgi:hypothetical protein